MKRVYVGLALTKVERDRIRQAATEVTVVEGASLTGAAAAEAFGGCEICFGRCPLDWIATSSALRWIQLDSVGFDDLAQLDWPELGKRITVTNLAGFFADPVAETALAGILALSRKIDRLVVLQGQRSWQKMQLRPQLRSLRDASVFLAGYGSIGRRVEELLTPLGCRFQRISRSQPLSAAAVDKAIAAADLVICSLPETPETLNFFDRRRLQLMKPEAIFVNVGRGGVVDEQALTDLLQNRKIGGAVLDVTVTEPLPAENPLWSCENVILTQHTAGGSVDEGIGKVDAFVANLNRYLRGEPLHGRVSWQRGY